MDLEEVKLYIKVDSDEDDELIRELIVSAENYLLNAGIKVDYNNPQYKTAVKMLVADWYDQRGINGTMGFMFKSIIAQLSAAKSKG